MDNLTTTTRNGCRRCPLFVTTLLSTKQSFAKIKSLETNVRQTKILAGLLVHGRRLLKNEEDAFHFGFVTASVQILELTFV